MTEKRQALGRGLSALIPEAPPATREAAFEVDLDLLTPNPFQPRVQFDESRLEQLAESIRKNGLIQPILVRRRGASYEIIAGERRWRAAQHAGLLKVPVVTRDVPDERLLEVALIENIQREDLNPVDEALAYRRLIDEFHLTQESVATAVGKDRASVANYLRLLKLPVDIRQYVASAKLSMGHARALVAIDDEAVLRRVTKEVLDRGLSVRQTEALVRRLADRPSRSAGKRPQADVHTRAAEDALRRSLGTRVRIVHAKKGGRIEIDFGSEEELNRLYDQLTERR